MRPELVRDVVHLNHVKPGILSFDEIAFVNDADHFFFREKADIFRCVAIRHPSDSEMTKIVDGVRHFAVTRMTNSDTPENVCFLPKEEMIRIIDEGDFVEAKNAWLDMIKLSHISDQFRAHLNSEIKKREAA